MKKIKYQGAATKIIAEKIAAYHKKNFLRNSERITKTFSNNNRIDFDVISFSGAKSFEDQLLSICSFIYYAGIPVSWTIYSDKSYTPAHKNSFQKYFPFVSVVDWDVFDCYKNYSCLSDYLGFCHLAKKVNVLLGHNYTRQTIYADSDVVFYMQFSDYVNNNNINQGLWYVSDVTGNRCISHLNVQTIPLNSGLLILNNEFQKQLVLDYFENLKGNFHYFSEQSSFDYAFKKQNASLLNPGQFIVDTDDQFDFSTKYSPRKIAMRHYVSPVRHKMWQNGWKWHFVR